ncbi:PH domain-containing protein [uncultured Actinomyces sp.]|uniref:PH domain-containing protein n=1 Tax=uncultured Actinomyces sp. TaxID=249061 RepID=UPI0015BE0A9A|nr:PH domain-containing protein [uncultured Actinomyces sp.]
MSSSQHVYAADQGVDPSLWRRVHVITPLLEIWQILVAGFALVTYRNFSEIQEMLRSEYLLSFLSERFFYLAGSALIVIAVLVGFVFLQWWSLAFAVTETAVWSRHGILKRQQRHARLDRIQAVDISQPVLARILGLGKLDVEVAGGSSSNITIGYLKVSELEALRGEILARAAGLRVEAQTSPQTSAIGTTPQSPCAPVQSGYPAATADPYAPSQSVASQTPANYSYTGEVYAPSSIPVAPERELYQVSMGRLLGSQMLSLGNIAAILLLIAFLVAGGIAAVQEGVVVAIASLGGFLSVAMSIVGVQWNRFASEANFRLAISPDGIRVRRGLLSTRAQTIPPRRIHAIQVQQPFFWRFLGWYRVSILQAGYGAKDTDSNKQQSSHILIPVGTRQDVEFALWMVFNDLGVDDVPSFIEAALAGKGSGQGFVQMSPRARFLDPFAYHRRARAITRTTFVIRDGWLNRKSLWAPIARLQSVRVQSGPLERKLGVASLHMDVVPGAFKMIAEHQDASQASADIYTLLIEGQANRASEPPEKWMLRVENGMHS